MPAMASKAFGYVNIVNCRAKMKKCVLRVDSVDHFGSFGDQCLDLHNLATPLVIKWMHGVYGVLGGCPEFATLPSRKLERGERET